MRFALLLATVAAAPLAAQTMTATGDDAHPEISPEIIVTAPFLRDRATALSAVSVLQGEALARDLRPQIGDILARQPGVSSTSFGPNASRPILRGFQGERIRILTDGIGSFDVSNTSVDHAVIINPLLAERIEVLRGPASLLYGSSAIGGVVNVIDKRIPRAVPQDHAHIDATGSYASAAEERSGSAVVDISLGPKVVAHLDGSYSKSGDLDIGGFVLSPTLRQTALASANADVRELAGLKDSLPNTAARSWQVAGGLAIIDDNGDMGISVARYDSLYGVPVRYSLDPAVEAEAVRLDVRQTRLDARAGLDLGGAFSRINARFGYADYVHAELEETGEVGTRFFNEGIEGRLELVQAKRGTWQGAVGAQLFIRDFNVIGEEAFVPENETVQWGLFTLQEAEAGPVKLEGGARVERTTAKADSIGVDRRFTAVSASAGASIALADGWRTGINLSRTERAPAAEELFADGPHAGTQAFEIGDPTFDKERSWGLEAVLRGRGTGYSFEASAYWNRFNDYIYETQTGAVEDDLPVFEFRQGKARYWGIEAQGSLTLAEVGDTTVSIDALGDYVRARITGVGPVPRIPPLRLLGGVAADGERIGGRVEVEWSDGQDRVAAFETETGGFTVLNASLTWRPMGREGPFSVIMSANNLTDATVRRHASFLKDYAPLGGRDLRVSVRASF